MDIETLKNHYSTITHSQPQVAQQYHPSEEHSPSSLKVEHIMKKVEESPEHAYYQEESKQVDEEYESKKCETKQECIRQLFIKYVGDVRVRDVNDVLEKVEVIRKRKKWYRKDLILAITVFYCEYLGQVRLSVPRYCQMNCIPLKKFLKKFKAYKEIFGDVEGLNFRPNLPSTLRGQADMSIQRAVELVYDGVFPSEYLQNRRKEVITTLSLRLKEIDPRILRELDNLQQGQRTYHVMFCFLVDLKMKLSWYQYRIAVKERAGYELIKANYLKTKRIFKKYSKINLEEEDSDEKTD